MNPRVPAPGKESFKTSGCKNLWGLWWWEKLPVSQKSPLERPTGSKNIHKTIPRPGSLYQKGLSCLWVVGEVTESQLRVEQVALFPL